jgi:hypothetical protein
MGSHGENMYLTVCSKDAAIYFPNNKPANFRVKLAKPLNLTGCWKVGLCEIRLSNVNINKVVSKKKKKTNVGGDDDVTLVEVPLKAIPSISIDCNICTGLIVNGIQTRTLRKVWGRKNIYKVFPVVYYVPVEKGYIDTIEFNLYTGVGTVLTFDALYGRVEMTLRLKSC